MVNTTVLNMVQQLHSHSQYITCPLVFSFTCYTTDTCICDWILLTTFNTACQVQEINS